MVFEEYKLRIITSFISVLNNNQILEILVTPESKVFLTTYCKENSFKLLCIFSTKDSIVGK